MTSRSRLEWAGPERRWGDVIGGGGSSRAGCGDVTALNRVPQAAAANQAGELACGGVAAAPGLIVVTLRD